MNSMRNFICVLMALMLAAFALPSMGAGQSQNKTYTLSMCVGSWSFDPITGTPACSVQQDPGAATQLQALFKNTSPTKSSSSFSSLDLFVNWSWHINDYNQVTVTLNGVQLNGTTNGIVDPNSPTGHIVISNLSSVKPGDNLVVSFAVSATSCGFATWNAAVWSGSSVGSGNFFTSQSSAPALATSVACGQFACSTSVIGQTFGNVTAFRSSTNKDGTTTGTTCDGVNAFVSNTTDSLGALPPSIVHFRWDFAGVGDKFSTAVFEYDVIFPAPLSADPTVGWLYQNGSLAINPGADPNADPNGPVVFIQAPQCLSGDLPAPYTTLAADVSKTDKKIQVLSTSANVLALTLPFPIVIGTERMDVTKITTSTNTWTVTRHTGGTTATTHSGPTIASALGDPVVSTPLPLLPGLSPVDGVTPLTAPAAKYVPTGPYTVGNQAQMCIPPLSLSLPDGTATFFDIGDAWHAP